jgi:hypothetical protein
MREVRTLPLGMLELIDEHEIAVERPEMRRTSRPLLYREQVLFPLKSSTVTGNPAASYETDFCAAAHPDPAGCD